MADSDQLVDAVQMLLGLACEPMKAWELQRAIGCRRSQLDPVIDRMTDAGTVTQDRCGYLTLRTTR